MSTTSIVYYVLTIIMSDIIDKNLFLDTSTIYKLSLTSKEMKDIFYNLPIQICLNKNDNAIFDSLNNATINYCIVSLDLRSLQSDKFKKILGVQGLCTSLTELNLSKNYYFKIEDVKILLEVPVPWSLLIKLDLSKNNIGPKGTEIISQKFAEFNNLQLTHLNLSDNGIKSEGVISLSRFINHCINLKELDLSCNHIQKEAAERLASAFTECTKLTNLNLSYNRLETKGTQIVINAIRKFSTLTHLNLCNNLCNNFCIDFEGEDSLRKLTHLNLSGNYIGSEGAKMLSRMLANNEVLTYLNLYANNIGTEGTESLTRAILFNLTHLDLSLNNIRSEGATSLAEMLKQCDKPLLSHLNLATNRLGSKGAIKLVSELEKCPSLTYLNFSGIQLGLEGAKGLSRMFSQNNPILSYLNLSYNKIGPKGAASIAKMISNCTLLKHLHLKSNGFGPKGVKSLLPMIKKCSLLFELDLSNNDIRSEGVKSLVPIIENCSLSKLVLSNNDIRSEGAIYLAEIKWKNLLHLDLACNSIEQKGGESIIKMLRECRTLLNLEFYGNNFSDNEALFRLAGEDFCSHIIRANVYRRIV